MREESEGPGSAVQGATRAKLEMACYGFLTSEHSARLPPAASLVWDRSAGSCERFGLVRSEVGQ